MVILEPRGELSHLHVNIGFGLGFMCIILWQIPTADLEGCIPILYASLEDRAPDVRTKSQDALMPIMIHLGYVSSKLDQAGSGVKGDRCRKLNCDQRTRLIISIESAQK